MQILKYHSEEESGDIEFNIDSQLQHQGYLLEQVDLVTNNQCLGFFGFLDPVPQKYADPRIPIQVQNINQKPRNEK